MENADDIRMRWTSRQANQQQSRRVQPLTSFPLSTRLLTDLKPALNVAPKLLNDGILALARPNRQVASALDLGRPIPRISIDHLPASLEQNHPASAHVPRPTSSLPVHVCAAFRHLAQVQGRGPEAAQAVHEGAAVGAVGGQPRKRLRLHREVVARALAAPFHAHQARAQTLVRGGWGLQGKLCFLGVQWGLHVASLAFDARVEGLREGVVDDLVRRWRC